MSWESYCSKKQEQNILAQSFSSGEYKEKLRRLSDQTVLIEMTVWADKIEVQERLRLCQ